MLMISSRHGHSPLQCQAKSVVAQSHNNFSRQVSGAGPMSFVYTVFITNLGFHGGATP